MNDNDEIQGFIIEKNTEGLSTSLIANKTSLKISPTGQIILNNVKIPKENILPRFKDGNLCFLALTMQDMELLGA